MCFFHIIIPIIYCLNSPEGASETHLNDVRPQAPVKQDVKPQDLKAGTALHMVGEAGAVVVLEDGVGGDDCLDDGIINVVPQFVHIHPFVLQVAVDRADPSEQDPTEIHIKSDAFI